MTFVNNYQHAVAYLNVSPQLHPKSQRSLHTRTGLAKEAWLFYPLSGSLNTSRKKRTLRYICDGVITICGGATQ